MFTKVNRALVAASFVLCATGSAAADDTFFNWAYADLCATNVGEWNECAPITLNVPAGQTATIEVETTATFYENDVSQSILACIGVRSQSSSAPASCIAASEAGTDVDVAPASVNDDLESVATSAVRNLTAGTYVISSLVAPQDDLLDIEPLEAVGKVRTKVRVACESCSVTQVQSSMIVVDGASASDKTRSDRN